jgi:hypothetical protein
VSRRAFIGHGLALLAALVGVSMARAGQDGRVFLWEGDGLRLETAALPRDQIVAFLLARGFDSATAGEIAEEGCIFRSAIGSFALAPGEEPVSVNLGDWRVTVNGQQRGLRLREDWAAEMARRGADPAAAIALEWALFPSEQSFGPEDYNWGLLSFALPPGTRFDVTFSWRKGQSEYSRSFTQMECSP